MSLKESKRKDEAEACFQQVVRLRPGCALSLGNLAGALPAPFSHCCLSGERITCIGHELACNCMTVQCFAVV